MEDHFDKTEKFRHAAPLQQNIKTNLKTHASIQLNRPQDCQGCQKNWKGLRFLNLVHFCANIQLKLKKKIEKKLKKTSKNRHILTIFVDFEGFSGFLPFWLNISAETHQGEKPWVLLILLTPLAPLGALKQWFELEKSSKSQCVSKYCQ